MLRLASRVLSVLSIVFACWGGAAQAQSFTCGPHTLTYELLETDAMGVKRVAGIRCVKVVNNHSFAWYGEGRWWGSFEYRHVGYAAGDNFNGGVRFAGSQGDIYGNGEDGTAFHNNTMSVYASVPITQRPLNIDVYYSNGFSEKWRLAPFNSTTYTPLPYAMSRCSTTNTFPTNTGYVEQLKVLGRPEVTPHVRCALNLKGGNGLPYAWVAQGWNGSTPYFHLGTGNFQLGGGWGLSDLCFTGSHYCNDFSYGSILLTRQHDASIFMSGALTETMSRFTVP